MLVKADFLQILPSSDANSLEKWSEDRPWAFTDQLLEAQVAPFIQPCELISPISVHSLIITGIIVIII